MILKPEFFTAVFIILNQAFSIRTYKTKIMMQNIFCLATWTPGTPYIDDGYFFRLQVQQILFTLISDSFKITG